MLVSRRLGTNPLGQGVTVVGFVVDVLDAGGWVLVTVNVSGGAVTVLAGWVTITGRVIVRELVTVIVTTRLVAAWC